MASLDARYQLIISYEQCFAKTVAAKIVDRPELSPWMILIPIIFVHYLHQHQRFRAAVDITSKEFMFTKQTALDAAWQMVRNGASKEETLGEVAAKVAEDDAARLSGRGADYAEKAQAIRRAQLKEIELLIDHYVRLFKAGEVGPADLPTPPGRSRKRRPLSGKNKYWALLKKAYRTRTDYTRFLEQLQRAEKEVNLAAKRAFSQTEGFSETISKLEATTAALRKKELEAVFSLKL